MTNYTKYRAEMIGTFGMVFFGTGAMIMNTQYNEVITHAGVAVAWGVAVMVMIFAYGTASGAHFNPAVSIGFATAKKMEWRLVPGYIMAQCLGAIFASSLLAFLFPVDAHLGRTFPSIDLLRAFIIETLLTFFLMSVILHVTTQGKYIGALAAIAIGGTVLLEALVAGPLTKASMNPARSLGPALVSGCFDTLWLYIIAPVLGALLAVIVFKHKSIL